MAKKHAKSLFLQSPLLPDAPQTKMLWQQESERLSLPSDIDRLAAIFAGSPHLHQSAKRFHAEALHHMMLQPIPSIEAALTQWEADCLGYSDDDIFMRAVRKLRTEIWLTIAIGEMSGNLSIQDCYHYLSLTAERVLIQTVKWIYAHTNTLTNALANIADNTASLEGCGYFVLALGKLGAGELNYSSDLDLVILHDSVATGLDRSVFITITRRLVHLLSAQTKDGFAFRIDLRLRPDPGATSISIEQGAALTYYESQARTWERAAYIRARPIAGDINAAKQFLHELQPFIWRRYLDYTVIEDLHVWLHKKPTPKDMLGFDVKNGAFGIRHIELLTHSLQLLNGGRHKSLRTNSTHLALQRLAKLNLISSTQAEELQNLYDGWRQIEHRVQYQRDAHLYRLPLGADDFSSFARFAGFENSDYLRAHIKRLQHETELSAHHPVLSKLKEGADNGHARHSTSKEGLPENGLWTDGLWIEDEQARLNWLAAQGFEQFETISQTIEGWLSGRIAATRGSRSQRYLLKLLPHLLEQLASADAADEAFAAFADIIAGQPAGAQIFALLEFHPKLVGLMVDIVTCAPQLADQIRRHPDVMELLLDSDFYVSLPDLKLSIEPDDPVETQLDHLRRQVRRTQFGISIHQLQNLSDESDIARAWTLLAEQATAHITRLAKQDMIRRHGDIDGDLVLIALGSFGRRAMSAVSDLDLIAVYNGDLLSSSKGQADGSRKIGLSAYMVRLTQTIVSWLTIRTAEGALYEVDMRLRPDGKAGPLAVHIDRFTSYYLEEAWPWERLAMQWAQPVAGEDPFAAEVKAHLLAMRSHVIDPARQAADLQKMRKLLHETNPSSNIESPWQLKRIPGGKLDCNLLTLLRQNRDDVILSKSEQAALQRIEYVSHWLQVGLGRKLNADHLPQHMGALLALHLKMPDQMAVRTQLKKDARIIAKKLDQLLELDLAANPKTGQHHHNK